MFNLFKRESALVRKLKKHPGHFYVEDKFMAVLLPDGQILAIPGDFKNIAPEAAQQRMHNAISAWYDSRS